MNLFHPTRLLAACSLACVSVSSSATEPVITLPEEIIIGATRFNEAARNRPVSVSIITAEQIRNSAAQTLPELLQSQAGIHIRNLDGGPDQQIDMRGFGITGNQNTIILLDGQRMNEIESTGIRWSTIPMNSIERIEVLRNDGAVTYGGGATGGVINIITRAATAGRIRGAHLSASGGVGIGSYGATDFNATLNLARENIGLALTANSMRTDNYRDNNTLHQRNLQGDLRYRFAQGSAMIKFGLDDQTLELPANRKELQLITNRRGTDTPRDFSTREGAYVTMRGEYNTSFANFAADLSWRDNHRTALFDDYFGSPFFSTKAFLNTRSNAWLFNPRIKVPFQTGKMEHELIIGSNHEWWDYHSQRFTGPSNLPGAASATTLAANILGSQETHALYTQYATTLPVTGTIVSAGGRIQWTHNQANDQFNTASYARDQQNLTLYAYDAGIRQPIIPAVSFYGKYGRSFRIATIDETYSQFGSPAFDSIVTLLEPQTAHTAEMGLEYKQGPVKARTSVYRTDLNHEISYMNINPFLFGKNINLPPTRRQGIEVEGSWAVTSAIELFGNYTYTDARFREGLFGGKDISGNMVPLVPRHTGTAGGSIKLTPTIRFSALMNYTGRQVYDNDQTNDATRRMPDYVTVDLKLSHQMASWLMTFAVNNLLDEKYYSYGIRNSAGTSFSALPARTRNFWFTIKYQFN